MMLIKNKLKNPLILLLSAVLVCLVSVSISHFVIQSGIYFVYNCKFSHFNLIVLYIALALISVALVDFIKHEQKVLAFILVGSVIGGVASNIYEFGRNTCIADYFNFFGLVHFNSADVFITLGALLLVFNLKLLV
ncbi:MAG TPA: signal peptidase II [Candidatus Saccharimonadales bacterium]|nr:signal peptidase II [Candidatus Saccharimonadales bacterium]